MNDNCKPPAPGAGRAHRLAPALQNRWKFSVLAAALAAGAGSYVPDASALVLGPVTVQSALGEPLRAEIDLPQITPAEAESLRAGTAAADVFRRQGMEYSATVSQMRVQLYRRPDGRTVLRLTGNSPVNEPFVDLVIDARWGAGQVTRSYTLLFDPPSTRRAPATSTAVAPALAAPDSQPVASAPRKPAAVPAPANAPDAVGNAAAPVRSVRPAPVPRNRPEGEDAAAGTVQVRPGDTAGRIANARRPQGVSLDQMLVALSRSNPDAFVQGNVNRLKAGSVLQIPGREEALATPPAQARQTIAVQSRDFNAFRRRLAGAAPSAEQVQPQRTASGSVQTQTQDASAPAAAPDKLTLSKGAMQGSKTTEEMLAQRKQGNEAAARTQELAKNIEELNRLSAASGTPAAPAPAPVPASAGTKAETAPAVPALVVPNPGLALPAEPGAAPAATDPALAEAGSAPAAPAGAVSAEPDTASAATPAIPAASDAAPATAAPPAPAPSAPPAVEPEADSFVQDLLDQPALPLAGVALLLLLAYAAYRSAQRRRRNQSMADSGFLDSRAPTDSFFGASGGQRVDTTSTNSTLGAMSQVYSHSQLDTGGEVDPVAEADVYLAYGRDLQAEEILREAARQNPARVPVFLKLAEIYAKRLDRKALEAVAADVHRLTQGQGAEWDQVVALGRTLEPDNALYQPGGAPAAGAAGLAAAGMAATRPGAASATTQFSSRPMDLDLSLDFDLPDDALTEVPGDMHSAPAPLAVPDLEPAKAPAQAQDWDALEDLVAFNAAIASPPPAASASAAEPQEPEPFASASPAATELPSGPTPAQATDTGPAGLSMQAPTLPGTEDANSLAWEELPIPATGTTNTPTEAGTPALPAADNGLDMDLTMDIDTDLGLDLGKDTGTDRPPPAAAVVPYSSALDDFAMHLELPALDGIAQDPRNNISPQALPDPAPAPAFVPAESGLMDFDFNDLSLDFDLPSTPSAGAAADADAAPAQAASAPADAGMDDPQTDAADPRGAEDALATKLALAQEFHTIGDSEGARTLVEEVIAESSGTLKARARQLLADMD